LVLDRPALVAAGWAALPPENCMRKLWHYWFQQRTILRAVKVAAIVGPVLTLINQYDVLLNGDYSPRVLGKIVLTFLVPYCVSSFSSARTEIEREALQRREKRA
jgi:hypothetical protein